MNDSYLKIKNHLEQSIEAETNGNFNSLTRLKRAITVRKFVYIIGFNLMILCSINTIMMIHEWTGFLNTNINLAITATLWLLMSILASIFVMFRIDKFETINNCVQYTKVSIADIKTDILIVTSMRYSEDMITIKMLDHILNGDSQRNKHK